jgi:hypothetical protein
MFSRLLVLVALFTAAFLAAQAARAENSPPISGSWNISASGKAASSGELLFRVTPATGNDPVEVSVFVLSGSNETGVASSIRRAFSTQLDTQSFDVAEGEGANVLLTGERSGDGFSVELIDSDVENLRVMVQSVAPVAPPTVPAQSEPANPPAPSENTPGNATPPAGPGPATPSAPPAGPLAPPAQPSAPPAEPSAPPAQPAAPPASPSAPPGAPSNANGGAGAPASAPPPPPGHLSTYQVYRPAHGY